MSVVKEENGHDKPFSTNLCKFIRQLKAANCCTDYLSILSYRTCRLSPQEAGWICVHLDVPIHITTITCLSVSKWWQPEAPTQWWLVNWLDTSFPPAPEIIITYLLQPHRPGVHCHRLTEDWAWKSLFPHINYPHSRHHSSGGPLLDTTLPPLALTTLLYSQAFSQ